MKCPYCGDQESKVVDSRHSEDGLSIRRRRAVEFGNNKNCRIPMKKDAIAAVEKAQ